MMTTSPNSARSFLLWVWSGVLILGGGLFFALSTSLIPAQISMLAVAAGAVAAISLPFLIRWAIMHESWALLAGWIFIGLSGALIVMYFAPGSEQLVLVAILAVIALPLIVTYLVDRERWWLLIPAYILIAAGILIVLTALHVNLLILAGLAFLAVIVPLWIVGAVNSQARWLLLPAALITAGALIGAVYFALLQPGTVAFYVALNGTLAALGLTTWIINRKLDVGLWLAAAFAAAAIASVWYPSPATWGIAALVLGVYLQVRMMRGRKQTGSSTVSQPASSVPPTPSTSQSHPNPPIPATTPPSMPAPKGPPPGVEFIPLDPFKGRKKEDE
jgi:hypothetical protein